MIKERGLCGDTLPPFLCFALGSLLNMLRCHCLISWEQINSISVLSSAALATGLYKVLRENTIQWAHPPILQHLYDSHFCSDLCVCVCVCV